MFALESKELGDLTHIVLEHDGAGSHDSWWVDKVTIRDVISNKKYYFHVQQWLSDSKGGKKRSVEVQASTDPNPPKYVWLWSYVWSMM